jgi:hypothetical protein
MTRRAIGILLCVAAAAVFAGPAAACAGGPYVYAGLAGNARVAGVGARITAAQGAFDVASGHVAGWVGIGGPGQGVGGADEWIQVGFSSFPGVTGHDLYYEVTRPGGAPRYARLKAGLAPGTSARVAVLEMRKRHNWWRVWVNGRAATRPIYLPSSDLRWRPIVTAESWDGGASVCNNFGYRFAAIRITRTAGGIWSPFSATTTIKTRQTAVFRHHGGFLASGGTVRAAAAVEQAPPAAPADAPPAAPAVTEGAATAAGDPLPATG